jgi:hypothetical protein
VSAERAHVRKREIPLTRPALRSDGSVRYRVNELEREVMSELRCAPARTGRVAEC